MDAAGSPGDVRQQGFDRLLVPTRAIALADEPSTAVVCQQAHGVLIRQPFAQPFAERGLTNVKRITPRGDWVGSAGKVCAMTQVRYTSSR